MTNRLLQIFVDIIGKLIMKGALGPGRMPSSCGRASTVPEGLASFFFYSCPGAARRTCNTDLRRRLCPRRHFKGCRHLKPAKRKERRWWISVLTMMIMRMIIIEDVSLVLRIVVRLF